jgi:hypothetical protein
MDKSKIPTIIGISILIIALAVGVALVQFRQVFRLGAAGGTAPKNVRVANIADTQVSISWVTEKESQGFVKWGASQSSLMDTSQDETEETSFTHMVTLRDLSPQKTYFFKINSGGDDFDNSGSPWQVKTGPALSVPTNLSLVSGSVLTATGLPAKNSLIYISVSGSLLSTLTSQGGTWVIPLSRARSANLSSFLTIDPARTLLEISVDAGPDGVSSAKIYPQSANPVPPMILGEVYDWKNLGPTAQGSLTSAEVNLPGESTPSSRFQVPSGGTGRETAAVTLDSTEAGEVVTSTRPEFFGSGPSGTKLSIELKSTPVSVSVSIPSSGEWKWSPTSPLEPGTHTITLSWRDAGGILRSLTRTFIVQAAEGPAFVSTPSATPTFKPTATPTPTIKPTATPTAPPTPESGGLTPTLLLFIMGISTMAFGVFLWREN